MDQSPITNATKSAEPVTVPTALARGRYVARLATTPDDIARAQQLRWLAFVGKRQTTGDIGGVDADQFDDLCRHILVEDAQSGQLVCCFRAMIFESGADIGTSYSAQFYELSKLREFDGRMLEMGRFCIHPAWRDADILRVAWGAMTRMVDEERIAMLFGCSSFTGTDWEGYRDALAMLSARHIAPRRWLPKIKAPKVLRYARMLAGYSPDRKAAQLSMPPLLKTYLLMGGWVSDHAVLDHDLDTLHVFTGLEIGAIPAGRARALRMVAG
jgi:putative hemolysin